MIILETERLTLRHLEPGDLEALYVLYRDPEIRQELEWHQNGHPQHPELGLWAAIHKESGQFIGRCGLLPWKIDGQDEVEIAYLIAKSYRGQGYATEAAQGILEYARATLGMSRLVCLIDEDNIASIRVAEKIGMAFEKTGEDEMVPSHLYTSEK